MGVSGQPPLSPLQAWYLGLAYPANDLIMILTDNLFTLLTQQFLEGNITALHGMIRVEYHYAIGGRVKQGVEPLFFIIHLSI